MVPSVVAAAIEVSGPDFITLLVRDLEASFRFYTKKIGLKPSWRRQPGTYEFDTTPRGLAIRQASAKVAFSGQGIFIWLRTADATALCRTLEERGVSIVKGVQQSVFGKVFSFRDPDGHVLFVHDGG
jgi:predicted enzyme related to lactoylglutathione lyase